MFFVQFITDFDCNYISDCFTQVIAFVQVSFEINIWTRCLISCNTYDVKMIMLNDFIFRY